MRAADLPARYNAAEILEHNLAARADKMALSSPAAEGAREVAGQRSVERTFADVAEEANRVGEALRVLGLERGDRVALLLPDLPEWPACFFGTLKAGGVALWVNTLRETAPA